MSDEARYDEQPDNAGDPAHTRRCAARTQKGTPCRNPALPGQPFCRVHLDAEAASAATEALSTDAAAPPATTIDAIYEVELDIRNQPVAATTTNGLPTPWVAELAAGALQLARENIERMASPQAREALDMLSKIDLRDYLDPDFWRGLGMVIGYQIREQSAFIQRRLRGEYETDPYGLDREVIDMVRPFLNFLYYTWWRTTTEGVEHVPVEGRALLVANHSGVLPWDGAMIATALAEEHPTARLVRSLYLHWFTTLPFVSSLLAKLGQVPGVPENAIRLLEDDELVCVFPEGIKGVGKLYRDRYRLARFGRGGFVQAALRTGAPLIPVAVVGAEEIYPMLANAEPLARLLGFPYFPITPFFPWLGPFGTIPLPTRWRITFGAPIETASYGPEAANDPLLVFRLSEEVRQAIQKMIDEQVAERKSVF